MVSANYLGYDKDNSVFFSTDASPGLIIVLTNNTYTSTSQITSLNSYETGPYVACFLDGVRIATPKGQTAVEALAAGDLVMTADGRAVAVKWIGRQSVRTAFQRDETRAPVCIRAGALAAWFGGERLPVRDLKLTADHALLLGGMLVQAGALVNGADIRRMSPMETGEAYTVWHIETEGHEIILAEGCPAETFVDNASRRRFDNHADYVALFGEDAQAVAELDLPRIKSARQLPASLRALTTPPAAA